MARKSVLLFFVLLCFLSGGIRESRAACSVLISRLFSDYDHPKLIFAAFAAQFDQWKPPLLKKHRSAVLKGLQALPPKEFRRLKDLIFEMEMDSPVTTPVRSLELKKALEEIISAGGNYQIIQSRLSGRELLDLHKKRAIHMLLTRKAWFVDHANTSLQRTGLLERYIRPTVLLSSVISFLDLIPKKYELESIIFNRGRTGLFRFLFRKNPEMFKLVELIQSNRSYGELIDALTERTRRITATLATTAKGHSPLKVKMLEEERLNLRLALDILFELQEYGDSAEVARLLAKNHHGRIMLNKIPGIAYHAETFAISIFEIFLVKRGIEMIFASEKTEVPAATFEPSKASRVEGGGEMTTILELIEDFNSGEISEEEFNKRLREDFPSYH